MVLTASLLFSNCAPPQQSETSPPQIAFFPSPGDTGINIDTQLSISFPQTPTIGTSGIIRIEDVATGELVDEIDMSIPPSPLPTGRFPPNTNQAKIFALGRDSVMSDYQVNAIGGVDFHFFPVTIRDQTATIHPHNNRLEYGRTYRVTLTNGVLSAGDGFAGVDQAADWTFTTKSASPPTDASSVTVAADGSGDFSTVQGALDFAPARNDTPLEILIKNGDYEEIVFVQDKSNIILRGESRDGVRIGYANNSAFNPPRGGPSRRPAVSFYNVADVQLSSLTINNHFIGQAEALLVRGERVVLDNMTLNGSGDAFTTAGSIYMVDSSLRGDGDTILAYATLYCLRCKISSVGPFVWPRTPQGQHGNVFVDSTFTWLDQPLPWTISNENPDGVKTSGVLARLPRNGPASSAANFPHAEMVLINSQTTGVPPEGWGPIEDEPAFDWSGVHLWEHNTTDATGAKIDMSKRHPAARELTTPNDQELIDNYLNPAFVFGGWTPVVR